MLHEHLRDNAADVAGDLIEVRHDDDDLLALSDEVAGRLHLSARSVHVEGLLHLPRIADTQLRVDRASARSELERVGGRIATRIHGYRDWLVAPKPALTSPRGLTFSRVSEADTRVVLERFHYLSSHRPDAQSYGLLTTDQRIVALATLSHQDIQPISEAFASYVAPSQVLVVSRLFAFDWSPPNTISHLFGLLAKVTRRLRPRVRLLITYLNPNLGFTGASYRASNWHLIGEENGTRYSYVDGVYATDRQLIRRWQTADPTRLAEILGPRFSVTSAVLLPLQLYASSLAPNVNEVLRHRWIFERPTTDEVWMT